MIYGHPLPFHHREIAHTTPHPRALTPVGFDSFDVPVAKAHPKWRGVDKHLLDADGKPASPPDMVLHLLKADRWDGTTRTGDEHRHLPAHIERLLTRIREHSRSETASPWDVVAWRGHDVLFVQCKRGGHEELPDGHRAWLRAALLAGVPLSAFLVVEWTLSE